MKKMIVLLVVMLLAASTGFAAPSATGTLDFANAGYKVYGSTDTTTGGDLSIGKLSTGVAIGWNTDVNGYALMTQHESGTKAYGTSYDSTALFQTVGAVDPGNLAYNSGKLSATDTTDFKDTSKWTSM